MFLSSKCLFKDCPCSRGFWLLCTFSASTHFSLSNHALSLMARNFLRCQSPFFCPYAEPSLLRYSLPMRLCPDPRSACYPHHPAANPHRSQFTVPLTIALWAPVASCSVPSDPAAAWPRLLLAPGQFELSLRSVGVQ